MIDPLPDTFREQEPPEAKSPWSVADLVVFVVFFATSVLVLPAGMVLVWQYFDPSFQATEMTAADLVLIQGVMNLGLVGFIAFLIKIVHGRSFLKTIHWNRNYKYSTRFLISLGATLALSVLIVSSFFPPSSPPPIERLLSSASAMWIFAIFGIGVAPIFEEVIFRGFLFTVLAEMRRPAAAVPVTAILFALLHVPQLWGSWAGVGLIFLVGYILSVIRHRSDSLIPSLIIHTAYNSMLFGVFILGTLAEKGASG